MSRIGRKPIPVPDGVMISIEPDLVRVSGPRGELTERVPRDISVKQEDAELLVTRPTDREAYALLEAFGMPFSREGNPYIENAEVPA